MLKKLSYFILITIFTINFSACSSSNSGSAGEDNDDTGTTAIENLSTNFQTAASRMVPLVTTDSDASVSSISKAITYTDDANWDEYLTDENVVYLTDLFESEDVDPAPVTRIRVLLDQFQGTLQSIITADTNFDCAETAVLNVDADTIEIAFLGEISNGEGGNRYFDCIFTEENDEGETTLLYGQDADGVIRIVEMTDQETANEEEVEDRGNFSALKQVVYSTYAEAAESETNVAYLDIQYTQASIYSGADDDFEETDDNILFKSRSRIAGRIEYDAEGNVASGTGDFNVIKYDRGINEDLSTFEIITKTIGRGNFAEDENFVFIIISDLSDDLPETFCLISTSTTPEVTETSNCTVYETALPWDESIMPFELSPEIPADINDAVPFSEAMDLIADDGSDFVIPIYE